MDRVYSPEEIKFIVVLTVVMVAVVAIATAISVCLSKRRNSQLIDREALTTNEYNLTSDVPEVWSVQGHYQQIVTWVCCQLSVNICYHIWRDGYFVTSRGYLHIQHVTDWVKHQILLGWVYGYPRVKDVLVSLQKLKLLLNDIRSLKWNKRSQVFLTTDGTTMTKTIIIVPDGHVEGDTYWIRSLTLEKWGVFQYTIIEHSQFLSLGIALHVCILHCIKYRFISTKLPVRLFVTMKSSEHAQLWIFKLPPTSWPPMYLGRELGTGVPLGLLIPTL